MLLQTMNHVCFYWESNVWITHPRSYQTVDEKDIISWTKVPDNYFQTIKVNH